MPAKTQMTINKGTLFTYFKLCATVLSKREKDDLLYKGVRVISTDQDLGFLANGNFNAISCWLSKDELDSSVTDKEEFDAIIEGAKTLDILTKSTVSDISLSFGSKEGLVELRANGKNQLRYLSSENFVELPEVDETGGVTVNLKRFYSFIKLLAPFSSEDIHKASLVGMCISDGVMYASDETKALTLRNTELLINPSVSISSELLDILSTILSIEGISEEWTIQLSGDGSYLVLTTNNSEDQQSPTIRVYIHRYNVDYPVKILEKANKVAQKNSNTFTFNVKEMISTLDRLSIFKDENDLLFLQPTDDLGQLRVIVKNLKTSEKGEEFLTLLSGDENSIEEIRVIPISFTAFFNMLKSFDNYLDEIQLRYGKNFVSFHYDDFEAWIVETIVDFKDEEI